ncbi:MAG TPA: putative porin [Chthoniobacterales bacterium]
MRNSFLKTAAAAFIAGAAALPVQAQDSGPLIDKLVEKGILTDQEGEEVRAELLKDFQSSSAAGKLRLSDSIKELKIYGDARLRWQYDDAQKQIASENHVSQRSRIRYRLRLYADFKFTDHFFGGFGLETASAADSGMQTVNPGFADSDIFISRAFLGYNFDDWGTAVAGKQKNPFYSNELYWDADIQPFGITESVAFHKLFGSEEKEAPASSGLAKDGYSKDGKTVAPPAPAGNGSGFELTLVAGQFYFNDNNEAFGGDFPDYDPSPDSDASNDAFVFQQQLIATYKFSKKTSVTVAPAYIFYNAADLGLEVAEANSQPFADAVGVSGETRYLSIINVPGEFKFPLGPLNAKVYWEFAWNIDGEDRYEKIYQLGFTVLDPETGLQVDPVTGDPVSYIPLGHDDRDDIAWLLGLEIGQGKGKGAWTLFANYRQVGISSIDPNLNDSDFALSRLNVKGWRVGATYWVTDFFQIALTAQIADNLEEDLRGGHATGGAKLADLNTANIYQVDLNWKF